MALTKVACLKALHVKLLWQKIPLTNKVGKGVTKAKPKLNYFCCIMWCDLLVIGCLRCLYG